MKDVMYSQRRNWEKRPFQSLTHFQKIRSDLSGDV